LTSGYIYITSGEVSTFVVIMHLFHQFGIVYVIIGINHSISF